MHAFDPHFYFPAYQPIVDVPSGHIRGFEVLARTHDADGKEISAGWLFNDDHVPLDTRIEVDRAIRRQALTRFAQRGDDALLFINISPHWVQYLAEGREPPTIAMLRQVGMPPERVVLEITENFGDASLLEDLVLAYKRAGMKVAIDDFGVGSSQIDRLISLNPDYLKIDMHMFKNASRKGSAANILLSLTSLADQSGCALICEGVETEQEFDFALECGAQLMQGWLFAAASRHPSEPQVFKKQISDLQRQYLRRKKQRLVATAKKSSVMQSCVERLVSAYESGRVGDLDHQMIADMGILRFFICTRNGEQTSPNYEFEDGGVIESAVHRGHFWCHRPYFPVLMAMNEVEHRRQVISRAYIDTVTRQLCKTYSIALSNNTVMLVDTLAEDDTLYVEV